MKKLLKIGAYIRVSTDKQVQIFEGSLDTQKYRMIEFVKNKNRDSKGWGEIVEFYIEEGISAGTAKRPQYQKMMSDVRKGTINLVLVHDVARLSRNTHDFEILLRELEKFGASYLSMKEQFDTSTPAGRLMMNMVVNMAQFEREQVSERVSINCHSRATRGFRNGGKIVMGYEKDPERNGTLIVNKEEAEKVLRIFQIFIELGSIGKTLPELELRGITPKQSSCDQNERPLKESWSYTAIQYLLTNRTYIGIKEVNKKNKAEEQEFLKPWQRYQEVKASWKAIVPEDVFNAAQKVLEESAAVERRRLQSAENRIFLLSGIIYCGECGNSLHGQSSHGANSVHRYYSHAKRDKGVLCSVKRIRADEVEQIAIDYLNKSIVKAGYFDRIEENLAKEYHSQPKLFRIETQRLRKVISDLDKEIASTFKLQTQLDFGSEAASLAAEHLEKLGRDRKSLVARLNDLAELELGIGETSEVRKFIEDQVSDFKKGFLKAMPAVKRRLIRKVLNKLVYEQGKLNIYFNTSEREQDSLSTKSSFNVVSIGKNEQSSTSPKPLEASALDFTSSFENLRKEVNGWGSRTRTCE